MIYTKWLIFAKFHEIATEGPTLLFRCEDASKDRPFVIKLSIFISVRKMSLKDRKNSTTRKSFRCKLWVKISGSLHL